MATVEPTITQPNPDLIRRLAATRVEDAVVLSLFVDLDPSQFPTPDARTSQLTSLLARAEELAAGLDLSHEASEALRVDIEDVRMRFEGPEVEAFRDARATAIYVCTKADLYEAVRLPRSIPSDVKLGPAPDVHPVMEIASEPQWCVLLVNRSSGRIFLGAPDRLRQIEDVDAEVHRQHSSGGWSQARFERGIQREVEWHLEDVGEQLLRLWELTRFEHLAIGCPEEMRGEVEGMFHSYVSERLRGRLSVDVEHSSVEEVTEALRPLADEVEEARERDVLDRLQQELGRGGRAVASRPDVSRALTERRVETLILNEPDGADDLIDLALEQSAEVLVLRRVRLDGGEAPAALLRF